MVVLLVVNVVGKAFVALKSCTHSYPIAFLSFDKIELTGILMVALVPAIVPIKVYKPELFIPSLIPATITPPQEEELP